jgi:hypothetical protein
MRMLESKGPLANLRLSGALDLTFASRVCRQVGSECQIRSTSVADLKSLYRRGKH